MPRANPESSFASAARHLFRHLNDVNALRRNPIVRSIVGGALERTDEAILSEIRDAVIAAAGQSSHTNISPSVCARRHQIVVAICAGESPPQTAARLGISVHHYYRERRAAAASVAKTLLEGRPAEYMRFEVTDPLRLLFTHAATLRDQGLAGTAVSMLRSAISGAPNDAVRTALNSELARSLIALGRCKEAVALVAQQPENEIARVDARGKWLQDHFTLTRAILAIELGDGAQVGELLERLARAKVHSERSDEEALDAIIECGTWYCQIGLFEKGRMMLHHARHHARQIDHVSARHQSGMALLAAYCAQQTRDDFDLEYQWLSEALAVSTSNGSVQGILAATAGLMQYYLTAGLEDDAFRLAQEGLRMAQGADGTRLLEQFVVQTAGVLLRTRYWRSVNPLIFQIEEIMSPGSVRWAYLKEFQGLFQMRARLYEKTPELFLAAYEGARKLNSPRLEGLALRDLATVRYRAGAVGEGQELMRTALGLLEDHSGVASLFATYDAAARVLGDRRLARLATQLKASLADRATGIRARSIAQNDGLRVARPLRFITRRSLTIGQTGTI